MKFTQAQLAEYNEKGYVIIACPFAPELTQCCLEAVEKVAIDPAQNTVDPRRNHFRLKPQAEDTYWCALDHSLPFLQIELHPEIVELAQQLIGENDIYFRNGGINELAPGKSFPWHRDSGDNYVEFMHYFAGGTVEHGCLRVIPGSHIGPLQPYLEAVDEQRQAANFPAEYKGDVLDDAALPGELSLEIDPGHMIVRSSSIFHSTWINRSDSGRLMHHWLFREPGSDNHRFRFEEYLTPALVQALTPQQRQVLWLERDFEICQTYQKERERELGKVSWGII
jgi:ectoine hydroxylase-related dioxygenase (phytanoyl-CoA dioxygenase family)